MICLCWSKHHVGAFFSDHPRGLERWRVHPLAVTAGVTAASIYVTDETPLSHVADFLGPSCDRVSVYDSPVRCRR